MAIQPDQAVARGPFVFVLCGSGMSHHPQNGRLDLHADQVSMNIETIQTDIVLSAAAPVATPDSRPSQSPVVE